MANGARDALSIYRTMPDRYQVIRALLSAPAKGIPAAATIGDGRDGSWGGAILRKLRDRGYARMEGPSPAMWHPTPKLVADAFWLAARAVETASAIPLLLLPPPAVDAPDRYERLSFAGAVARLEQFSQTPWIVTVHGESPSASVFISATPTEIEIEWYEDEIVDIWFGGTLLSFSRRGLKALRWDRCMQELTFRQGDLEATIEVGCDPDMS